jgi:hypothetical protein
MHGGSSEGSEARFTSYVEALGAVLGHADRQQPMHDYCLGLLMPIECKSVEPMAAVTAPAQVAAKHQSLLHFVGNAPWSDAAMLANVGELVLPAITRSGPIEAWIIDDTGFPKKGRHSVVRPGRVIASWSATKQPRRHHQRSPRRQSREAIPQPLPTFKPNLQNLLNTIPANPGLGLLKAASPPVWGQSCPACCYAGSPVWVLASRTMLWPLTKYWLPSMVISCPGAAMSSGAGSEVSSTRRHVCPSAVGSSNAATQSPMFIIICRSASSSLPPKVTANNRAAGSFQAG